MERGEDRVGNMDSGLTRGVAFLAVSLALGSGMAVAAECPGNPKALGTSRTIVVDPREHARIGTMDYAETLPLVDKEVVLTFDDGPLPPYTNRILDILAAHCVRSTFFIVGRMARANAELVQRAQREGHTIGTHSMHHPMPFQAQGLERARGEIEKMLGHRCHLQLFVKVEEDWRDKQRLLNEMGIA